MKHRFFVEADQIRDDTVVFADQQVHQMRNVLRLSNGDQVRVFDGVIQRDLVVELVEAKFGRVVGNRPQAAEPATRLCVYPALLQRDKFETVLQKLTEVGAAVIVPTICARGLVRQPPDERRRTRWRAILREAAEQCGRGVVPQLGTAISFDEALSAADGTRIVAYECERQRQLWTALPTRPITVSLFIGPEGGLTEHEAESAGSTGAQLITLGERILRSETASPILSALVLYELERRY